MASDTAERRAPLLDERGRSPSTSRGLRLRTGEREGAAALLAEVGALPLSEADREALAGDLTTPAELAADLRS